MPIIPPITQKELEHGKKTKQNKKTELTSKKIYLLALVMQENIRDANINILGLINMLPNNKGWKITYNRPNQAHHLFL